MIRIRSIESNFANILNNTRLTPKQTKMLAVAKMIADSTVYVMQCRVAPTLAQKMEDAISPDFVKTIVLIIRCVRE